jgi:hypothetical protein
MFGARGKMVFMEILRKALKEEVRRDHDFLPNVGTILMFMAHALLASITVVV